MKYPMGEANRKETTLVVHSPAHVPDYFFINGLPLSLLLG